MIEFILLALLAIFVGAYGTIVGVGGGFVLVPVLLILYPQDPPATLTALSLSVVFVNALSGTLAYSRQRRIDYSAAILFATATVPGAILGARAVTLFRRGPFDLLFSALLVLVAIFLLARPLSAARRRAKAPPSQVTKTITDSDGHSYTYSYNRPLGMALSVGVGFVSSLLGIGGGIIHVPILVLLLRFPPHIATATSLFILTATAATGAATHLATGNLSMDVLRTQGLALVMGVLPGALLGAWLSRRVQGSLIIRLLALALILVSVRLLWMEVS
ncbi:MAG: sulfite exporter TauE/SafE family protein [Chloroflexi bacterium]|nr:sulfite exporter TauE/SafE family protein [Chloroflexota bacterium]